MSWKASDAITTDKYLAAFPQHYYKMDVMYSPTPLFWRGRVCNRPTGREQFVISGHSDFPITDSIVEQYPHTIWFGVNNTSRQGIGLPLGITNDTDETDVHRVYGNIDMMIEAVKTPRDIQNLVYMNFAIHTYPAERERVAAMFRGKEWVTVGTSISTMEGRKTFLKEMRNHSYVLCPRGAGIDTHRLWEALYMGSIPIVLWDIAHAGWTDLPILFVKSWEDVTEEMLRKELDRFQTTEWNMQKLHIGYWISRIQNEVGNNPRRYGYKSSLLRFHP